MALARTGGAVSYRVAVSSPEDLIPGGLEPPEGVAPEVFDAAMRAYLECRRVDMGQIAADLGVVRSTVFRRAGRRDDLIAHVIWYLTRQALARSIASADGLVGTERVLAVIEHFIRTVTRSPNLRAFLEREPEIALRILTSKHGPMQPGITQALTRLLEEEHGRGLILALERETLAYAIVRLGEGFLYADVVADQEPDADGALALIASLVRAHAQDATATDPKTVR